MYCHRETQKREGFGCTLSLLFGSQENTYDESAAILTCAQNVVSKIINNTIVNGMHVDGQMHACIVSFNVHLFIFIRILCSVLITTGPLTIVRFLPVGINALGEADMERF